MEKVRYHEMLPHEIVARRREFPVAFLPLGVLEYHGEHLAVGLDGLKSEKLCDLAAQRSGGFSFPPLWYGEPRVRRIVEFDHGKPPDEIPPAVKDVRSKMGFQDRKFGADYFGTTPDDQVDLFQRLLYQVLVQMNTLEMRAVCLVCGHYPLSDFAQPVVERFNSAFGDTQAFAGKDNHWTPASEDTGAGRAEAWGTTFHWSGDVGGDHAAKWETSYLWYLRPDCVDLGVYRGRETEELPGVMGADPRKEASIEVGRRGCELIVEGLIAKARELLGRVESASGGAQ